MARIPIGSVSQQLPSAPQQAVVPAAFGLGTGWEAAAQGMRELDAVVGKINEAERSRRVLSAQAKAVTALQEFTFGLETDTDYDTHWQRYQEFTRELKTQVREDLGNDARLFSVFDADFSKLEMRTGFDVRRAAVAGRREALVAALDDDLDLLRNTASSARSDAEADEIMMQGFVEVEDLLRRGFLTPQQARERRDNLRRGTTELRARRDLIADPERFLVNIQDRNYRPTLDEVSRQQLHEAAVSRVDALRRERQAAARAAEVEAISAVRSAQNRMGAGFAIPPDEIAAIDAAVARSGSHVALAGWRDTQMVLQDQIAWRQMTPRELEGHINSELLPSAHEGGASELEFARLEMASRLHGAMTRRIAADPLGWAAENGMVIPPLDMSDPVSLRNRQSASASVLDRYGNTGFFTPAEAAAEAARFSQMSSVEKVNYVGALVAGVPDAAMLALAQISETAPIDANLGGMMIAASQYGRETAEKAWRGLARIAQDPNQRPPQADADEEWRAATYEAVLRMPPQAALSMRKIADALYVETGQNPDLFDTRAYDDAIRRAFSGGVPVVAGTAGIDDVFGVQTVLPVGIARRQFEDAVKAMTEDDFAELALNRTMPFDPVKGEPVELRRFRTDAVFHMYEPNHYVVWSKRESLPYRDAYGAELMVRLAPTDIHRLTGAEGRELGLTGAEGRELGAGAP
jgi:hypothetical protein